MSRPLCRATAAAVLPMAFLLVPATSAVASPVLSQDAKADLTPSVVEDSADCPSGYLCLWGNRDWSGGPALLWSSTGSYNTGFFNNDETSSVRNRTPYIAYLYKDTNQGGASKCLPSGYAHRNLDLVDFDDTISSVKLTTGTCPASKTIGYPI